MKSHAFVARLNPQHREQYIEAHRNVPTELLARYHQAGIRNLSIFLREDILFLYLECDNYEAALASLENDPIEREWGELMSPMLVGNGYQQCSLLFPPGSPLQPHGTGTPK
jgi:L-rhamnose mutarotase